MKKIILSAFMLMGLAFSSQAQEISKNALGLRLGDNDGFGGEISYQRGLSDNNRLELDLGWRNSKNVDAFKLTGIYQWVWNIDGGFNWYAGVGGGVGNWSIDAHIGIQVHFDTGYKFLIIARDSSVGLLDVYYGKDFSWIQNKKDILSTYFIDEKNVQSIRRNIIPL